MSGRRLLWVVLQRFDRKPDKSTWLEMGRGLRNAGWSVELVTSYGARAYRDEESDLTIQTVERIDRWGLFRISVLINVALWLWRHADRDDVVILSPESLWLLPILRARGVQRVHLDVRTVPVEVRGAKRRLDLLLWWRLPLRLFARRVTSYSFITRRLRDAVEIELGRRLSPNVIWESGVDVARFRTLPLEPVLDGKITLFYHGTLSPNRGLDHMIRGFALLPIAERARLRLVIVGDGPDAARLRALVATEQIGDSVEFRGLVPYEDVPGHLQESNCCICPLPSRPEWDVSSPLKVFEYMAAGKAMILTPIPAHQDVLDDSEFVVWTRGSTAEDFAAAIRGFLSNREQLEAAAATHGPTRAEAHGWSHLASRLAGHLRDTFGKAA